MTGGYAPENGPMGWMGRFPIFLSTVLVAVHVMAMVFVSLLMALGQESTILALSFSSEAIMDGSVWQFLTYALVNRPSLWFAVEMYMLLTFGSEVERRIGRTGFGWLYLTLVLAPPTVLTGLALAGIPSVYAGSGAIHLAVFVGFVAIHPRAPIFFGLEARWVAVILLGINSLQLLGFRAWLPLGVLWLEIACVAFMLLRAGAVSSEIFPGRFPEFPKLPKPAKPAQKMTRASKSTREQVEVDPHASIDPLLEKISKHGIGSLTKAEREKLERARALLLERERKE